MLFGYVIKHLRTISYCPMSLISKPAPFVNYEQMNKQEEKANDIDN